MKRRTRNTSVLIRPPSGSVGGSLRAKPSASAIASAAPAAGSSVARSETSPGSRPTDVSVPASTIATNVTALVSRNSAACRLAASSAGTPMRVITYAPNAGPPAPPAGRSTFAPCSASPRTSARVQGITRSNTDHSARTNPRIEPTEQAAAATIHFGSADESLSRISPTPGSDAIRAIAAIATTAKNPARLASARTSTDSSCGWAGVDIHAKGWQAGQPQRSGAPGFRGGVAAASPLRTHSGHTPGHKSAEPADLGRRGRRPAGRRDRARALSLRACSRGG